MDNLLAFYTLNVAAAVDATAGPDIVSLIVTSVISATVFTAIIGGIVQYIINRRNARITERKNAVDAESDLIARYKEAASEERAQKESAVQTVKNLLSIAESQVESLKSTITTLNQSIDVMTKMANTQQEVIDQLTYDRDRMKIDLERAEEEINKQKEEIILRQQEILELTYPKKEIDELRRKAAEQPDTAK